MPINTMIQLCRVTRASKLFQRNFYLPLLRPLSPKDALRKHIISGKNLLGSRIEHYIPVLEDHAARIQRRKYTPKGQGKKRQRKKTSMKYLMPMFDDEMENHSRLMSLLGRKSKGKGQCYTYFIPDKNYTIVLSHQLERAIRDHDILDVIVAQRSEKIVVKLKDGMKITLPLVSYDGRSPFYAGEGWTKKDIEEYHHHGKETMSIAKLFEAKESGVEEWELEMMRMSNKRKKKQRGEGTADWKQMMTTVADNMDWDKFEEDTKQIVEEAHDLVEDDPIQMEVDNMDKTINVAEKLRAGGQEVLDKLPQIPEIPEILKALPNGELTEVSHVSGVTLTLPSNKQERFVPGQMVKSEEGEIFVPGQTLETDDGDLEYTPGFTVMMEGEPTLIPGLVMGDDPSKAMFLPGESTITETGELQFTETEDDRPREPTPPPEEVEPEVEEVELEEEQNSDDEMAEKRPPPPPKPKKKEFIYERPKRVFADNMGPKRRERGPRKMPQKVTEDVEIKVDKLSVPQVLFDLTVPTFEKDLLLQEKERVEEFNEKKAKEEVTIDKLRRDMRVKMKQFAESSKVPAPKYRPQEPVKKSEKLKDLETSIKKGNFFEVDHKKFLVKDRQSRFNWKEHEYGNTFDTVGMQRHRVWKSVY